MDYGWVPFEPTVSQPALILPAGFDPTGSGFEPPDRGDSPVMDDVIEEPLTELDQMASLDPEQFEVLPPRIEGSTVAWMLLITFLLLLVMGVFVLQRPDLFKINIDPLPVLLERLLLRHGKTVPSWLRQWSYLTRMSTAQKAYRRLCRSLKILGQPLDSAQTPAERAQAMTHLIPMAYQPALEIVHQYHLDKFSDHLINEGQTSAAGWQVLRLALKTRISNLFNRQPQIKTPKRDQL